MPPEHDLKGRRMFMTKEEFRLAECGTHKKALESLGGPISANVHGEHENIAVQLLCHDEHELDRNLTSP